MKADLIKSIYSSRLKSRAVLVMNYLIYRANNAGTCFPAIKTIAKECHISVNTVKRALDDLTETGFVKKEARFIEAKNGAQTSNLYSLSEVHPTVNPENNFCEKAQLAHDDIDIAETFNHSVPAPPDDIPHESFESLAAKDSEGQINEAPVEPNAIDQSHLTATNKLKYCFRQLKEETRSCISMVVNANNGFTLANILIPP